MVWLKVLALILCCFQLAVAVWVYLGWQKLKVQDHLFGSVHLPPISVVICTKNEERHLTEVLTRLLTQVYPVFEVLVVDDGSTDNTLQIATQFSSSTSKVRVIQKGGCYLPHKKGALEMGIDYARFECCVFTDADCLPADSHWLQRFGSAYNKGADVVIGTGLFFHGSSLITKSHAYVAYSSMRLYHAAAAWGQPFMCVGRSMGYKKSAFKASGGFSALPPILSGSDDLLLQAIPNSYKKVSVPDAVTFSYSPKQVSQWYHQRSRHLGTARFYPFEWRIFLPLHELSELMVPILVLWLAFSDVLVFSAALIIWLFSLGLKMVNNLVISKLIPFVNKPSNLDVIAYPAIWLNALISIATTWHTKKEWKVSR